MSQEENNGFTKIDNELLSKIALADFTSRELKVLLAILRKTAGYQKDRAPMSTREIAQYTGIHQSHIVTAIIKLIEYSVLIDYGTEGRTRVLGINTDCNMWNARLLQNQTKIPKRYIPNQYPSRYQNGIDIDTKTVSHTIERKERNKRKHSPEFLSLWKLYPSSKRYGKEHITEEEEKEILENESLFRDVLERYLLDTDERFIVKAERFFRELWKELAEEKMEYQKKKEKEKKRFE